MNNIVLYISSKPLKQTIEHAIKESELLTIECNNQVGNIISLSDFIKYKGLSLSEHDADYMILDLGAIKDSDEEILIAIESFLMTHENCRVIIVSQIHEAGDKLLSDLFRLGIRNFAVSYDYVEIKNELLLCLTEKGMSYKEAYEYKEVIDHSTRKQQELKEINKVMLGIIGTQTRVGCTHNSIIIANELKEMGYSVAVLECNQTGALEELRLSEKLSMVDTFFVSRNIDYYPDVDAKGIKDILKEKVYNFLVLDFGDFEKADMSVFNRCHVKIGIGSTQAWEIGNIVNFYNIYDEEARSKIHLYFNFIEKEVDKKELIKVFGANIGFIGFTPDPFAKRQFPNLKGLLVDYLPEELPRKKGIFGFLKSKQK